MGMLTIAEAGRIGLADMGHGLEPQPSGPLWVAVSAGTLLEVSVSTRGALAEARRLSPREYVYRVLFSYQGREALFTYHLRRPLRQDAYDACLAVFTSVAEALTDSMAVHHRDERAAERIRELFGRDLYAWVHAAELSPMRIEPSHAAAPHATEPDPLAIINAVMKGTP